MPSGAPTITTRKPESPILEIGRGSAVEIAPETETFQGGYRPNNSGLGRDTNTTQQLAPVSYDNLINQLNKNTLKFDQEILTALGTTQEALRKEILNNLTFRSRNGSYTEQSNKATCTMCSVESTLFNNNKDEFARIMVGLLTKQQVKLRNGEFLSLKNSDGSLNTELLNIIKTVDDPQKENPRDPPRDLVARIFQETIANKMAVDAGGIYTDPSKTIWTSANGIRFQGFTDAQFLKMSLMLANEQEKVHYDNTNGQITSHIKTLTDQGKYVSVVLGWAPDGTHSKHAVTVAKVENGKVYLLTGHHKGEGLPHSNGPKRDVSTKGLQDSPPARFDVITIEEFNKRLSLAILPEKINGKKIEGGKTLEELNASKQLVVVDMDTPFTLIDDKPTFILNPTSETQQSTSTKDAILNSSEQSIRPRIQQITPEIANDPNMANLSQAAQKALEDILLWHYRTKILGHKPEQVASDLGLAVEEKKKPADDEPAKEKPKE